MATDRAVGLAAGVAVVALPDTGQVILRRIVGVLLTGMEVLVVIDARRHFGLAGQYAAVDENLTGRENLRLVGWLTHLTRPAARRRAESPTASR